MLSIIDKYILKRYLSNFVVMLLLFVPIGIVIDVSEKINKMLENKVPTKEILNYYFYFVIHFANFLFPIFLFLSIIWFTSKLANNTEIVAILSSGISFTRFLRPYFIGATMVCIAAFIMGFFIAPKASEVYNNFRYTYLIGNGQAEMRQTSDVFRQISDDEFIYVSNFNPLSKTAFNFSYEKFKGEQLEYKITANRILWDPNLKSYILYGYAKRIVGPLNDIIVKSEKQQAKFNFDLEDLTPTVYVAETLNLTDLQKFIARETRRGNANINVYKTVLYKKYSVPVSAFILTIIAVSVSAMKRRGGMGMSLALGIVLAFSYVFFDKIFGAMAEKSTIPPILAVWIPNIVFGVLAIYLLRNAKR